MNTYILLILAGAVLMALEIFVPGGVAGLFGALLILWAAFYALTTVGGVLGASLAVAAVIIGIALLFLVIRIFPKSFVGRNLSLDADLSESHAADAELSALVGAQGVATTLLRPAGFAEIGGKRVDVVTRGESIESGAAIKVIEVEGNRVVVAKI
ncbi:MAG: NfeD family protein [Kiritimatiellia bacterium]|jgi:membrane-bound serine protease (ClpP class)